MTKRYSLVWDMTFILLVRAPLTDLLALEKNNTETMLEEMLTLKEAKKGSERISMEIWQEIRPKHRGPRN